MSPLHSSRLKIAYIGREGLGGVLSGRMKTTNWPDDATVVKVVDPPDRDALAIWVHSSTFGETTLGELLPVLHLEYRTDSQVRL